MLMPCRYSSFSFVLQPIIIVGRTCIRSFFLHSFLLTGYCNQILMLTIVDISVVILCFKMRTLFYNHNVFAFYFIYMLSFVVFDLFLFIGAVWNISFFISNEITIWGHHFGMYHQCIYFHFSSICLFGFASGSARNIEIFIC